MIGLMPSPTMLKACVAPQAIRVSTMMSEVFSSGVNRGAGCGVTRASVSEGDAPANPEVLAPTASVLTAAN